MESGPNSDLCCEDDQQETLPTNDGEGEGMEASGIALAETREGLGQRETGEVGGEEEEEGEGKYGEWKSGCEDEFVTAVQSQPLYPQLPFETAADNVKEDDELFVIDTTIDATCAEELRPQVAEETPARGRKRGRRTRGHRGQKQGDKNKGERVSGRGRGGERGEERVQ